MLLDRAAGKENKHAQVVVPHIKSLKKDVVELIFSKDDKGTWICPLTQKDIIKETKGSKFVYMAACGHVFSERGYKELDFTSCYLCDKEVDKEVGVVIINPTSSIDIAAAEKRMEKLKDRGLTHSMTTSSTKKRKHDKPEKKHSAPHKKKKHGTSEKSEKLITTSEPDASTTIAT